MSDTDMLKKILSVWVQPYTGPEHKTVGEWRQDIAAVLGEALEHWQANHSEPLTYEERGE